ncbi:hypothetical protein B1146_06645 [Enterococcus faecium]|nr:hypothetical protein B1146_06645 [Enterococcus faecium]
MLLKTKRLFHNLQHIQYVFPAVASSKNKPKFHKYLCSNFRKILYYFLKLITSVTTSHVTNHFFVSFNSIYRTSSHNIG